MPGWGCWAVEHRRKSVYKYILFDLDGTLTDPFEGITKSVQYALADFGIASEQKDLAKFIGPPLEDSFRDFYGFTREQCARAIAKYRERFSTRGLFENALYPGVPHMLAALQKAGKSLAVASSKPEVFVRRITDHFALTPYFDAIVGSELSGGRGTKALVVEEALARLCAVAENTLMVGDRRHDIEGAHAMGLAAAGVEFGYAEAGELAAAGAEYIAPTVEALEALLLSL